MPRYSAEVETALWCVRADDLPLFMITVDRNSDLVSHWKLLTEACFLGRPEFVRLLLSRGANPDVLGQSSHRYRPLHRAIEPRVGLPRNSNHVDIVEQLLRQGANPLLRATPQQVSAIALAAMTDQHEFLGLLVDRAPIPDIFHSAVTGDADRVRYWVGKQPDLACAKDENGWQALEYCARSRIRQSEPGAIARLVEIAEVLLAQGADPEMALPGAVLANNARLTRLFVQRGARVRNGDVLVHAAQSGFLAALQALYNAGQDIECRTGLEHHGGYTPLGSLVALRSYEGVRWFLERGANPNAVGGPLNETALHVALRYHCRIETVRLLLEFGADAGVRDAEGETALDLARRFESPAIELLLKGG